MKKKKMLLSLKNISKAYPGVQALDDVSIDFYEGEVHCLVGENGAGKSTLIKQISGAEQPDSGIIEFSGKKYNALSSHLSRELGIETIYQEFNLVPSLCVAENIFLGRIVGKAGFVDKKSLIKQTQQLLNELCVDINPNEMVGDLSVAYLQLIEIAKAISKQARVLILDEPTAALTTREVEILFDLIKKLRSQGVSIIYISHRLEELFELGDYVTVLRDGKKISNDRLSEYTRERLISDMVGREMREVYPIRKHELGDVVLEARNIRGEGVNSITVQVRAGEILGLAGLVGAGRTELVRLIFGADPLYGGEIYLFGKKVNKMTPKKAVGLGIGLIPEDRKRQGIILRYSIKWNICLPSLAIISKTLFINQRKENDMAKEQEKKLKIKTPSLNQQVGNLSGGNQQKVVVAKWLARHCKVLIMDEPTRGIDVGAKQEIYALMHELAKSGIAIIMISSEMEEVMGITDRIIVLREGDFATEIKREEYSQERILSYAAGY